MSMLYNIYSFFFRYLSKDDLHQILFQISTGLEVHERNSYCNSKRKNIINASSRYVHNAQLCVCVCVWCVCVCGVCGVCVCVVCVVCVCVCVRAMSFMPKV